MGQFERIKLLVNDDVFNHIQNQRICVFGVGGVGGIAVESFVRSGITKLILVDFDKVEESNINRQIQATHKTIGQDKTTALKARLLEINPDVEIIEVKEFIDESNINFLEKFKVDYVVDAIDSLSSKVVIIDYCVRNNIPIISSCGMGNRLDPSQIKVTRLDKTYNDPLAKRLRIACRSNGCGKIKVVFSSEIPVRRAKPIASLSYMVNVAGLMIVSEVMKELGVSAHEV